MKLTEAQITTIVYRKETSGETTSRVVIPTSVPQEVVRTIDVSDLNSTEREHLASLYQEYIEYKNTFLSRMFNFEDWASQTHNLELTPKWRAFKSNGLL